MVIHWAKTPTSGLSTAQLVAAMERSPIGTALVELDGRWIWTNIVIREMLGYGRNEIGQLDGQAFTHPDDLAADRAQAERLVASEVAADEIEKRLLRKDGSVLWCRALVSLVRNERGAPQQYSAKIEDISERKSSEIERAALVERLQLATEAGGVGVWRWDVVTGQMICNPRMFE